MRWMASELCHRETNYHKIEGYREIPQIISRFKKNSFEMKQKLVDEEDLIA